MFHVGKYTKKEAKRFIRDKRVFDAHLASQNYICDETKQLIDEVETKIIKDQTKGPLNTEHLINVTQERSTEMSD